MASVHCSDCGVHRDAGTDKCQACGSSSVVVTPDPASGKSMARGGSVIEGPDGTIGRRVDYHPSGGGRAVSRTSDDGALGADLEGPLTCGRKNEPRVLKTLVAALRDLGRKASVREGADDGKGEDGLIDVEGENIPVQIVTIPADETLWAEVSRGRGHLTGETPDAVAFVRKAIQRKTLLDPVAKRRLWLVLDASKIGALCSDALVGAYLGAHGDPAVEFGFAAVWIVGPTTGTTRPLSWRSA